jgi:hypothetical protein
MIRRAYVWLAFAFRYRVDAFPGLSPFGLLPRR